MMIKSLFETHIQVSNLERSIDFYKNVLKLELAYIEDTRRIAFFWIGKSGQSMVGLWETTEQEIEKRHFAFGCDIDFILNESVEYLKSKGLRPYNFFQEDSQRPMVFAWMPAVAIYFNDLDDNSLEFIAMLEEKAKPELGVISYEDWRNENR
ncbi:MAG: lactoylglutathione lyase [Cognaticolwellia sp.]|jgi:lactoylglutathione lyase